MTRFKLALATILLLLTTLIGFALGVIAVLLSHRQHRPP